jgi:hypothetical protein
MFSCVSQDCEKCEALSGEGWRPVKVVTPCAILPAPGPRRRWLSEEQVTLGIEREDENSHGGGADGTFPVE